MRYLSDTESADCIDRSQALSLIQRDFNVMHGIINRQKPHFIIKDNVRLYVNIEGLLYLAAPHN